MAFSGAIRLFGAPRSMRARLTLLFALLIAVLLLIADVVLLTLARTIESNHANISLRNSARHVVASLASAEDEMHETQTAAVVSGGARHAPDFSLPENIVNDARKTLVEEQAALIIVDPATGRVWRAGNLLRGGPRWPRPAPNEPDDGWRIRWIPAPVSHSLQIFVAFPWWREQREQRSRLLMLGALSLLVVAATAAGAWTLVGRTLSPIDLLARQAAESSESPNASALTRLRLRAPSPDAELMRLVETLNRLIGHVEESADARGRFYAAASHELRTPLHALAGQVELTLGRPRTGDEYRDALVEVSAQAERLTALVESLLLLNRLENARLDKSAAVAPPLPPSTTPTSDVLLLCHRLLHEAAPLIADRRLAVSFSTTGCGEESGGQGDSARRRCDFGRVNGAVTHVEVLVRNLLENALRYAPENSAVRFTLRCAPAKGYALCFETENEAPNLSPEQVTHLGEAFFRPDRSRTGATGGNGLGLTLCRSLVDVNGWKLKLEKNDANAPLHAAVCFPEAPV